MRDAKEESAVLKKENLWCSGNVWPVGGSGWGREGREITEKGERERENIRPG